MWIQEKANGVILHCQIQPRASSSEVVGLHGEPPRLKVRVSAPPVDGEANEELIAFLSKKLKVPKSRFEIKSGHTGKYKELFIAQATAKEIEAMLKL